jgi:drug/metabolite transporter (DMT)-like permease
VSGIVLALISALVYGSGDFCGGLASRRAPALTITFASQCFGLVSLPLALLLFHGQGPVGTDLAWGAVAGVVGATALVLFYGALAAGTMSVVAPVTAVVSATVPVLVGVATGERPAALAYVGIVIALPAIALIGREDAADVRAVGRRVLAAALAAGVGFGAFFVLLSKTTGTSGLWPLFAARSTSLGFLIVVGLVTAGGFPGFSRKLLALVAVGGVCDTAANGFYLAAIDRGLLSVVAVIAALYPASTVVLARVVIGERVRRVQLAGFGLAALAVVLVAGAST